MIKIFIPDEEFIEICKEIAGENKSREDWEETGYDDMFQTEHYYGGWEDDGFFFIYHPGGQEDMEEEYWFDITLEQAEKISKGEKEEILLRLPD